MMQPQPQPPQTGSRTCPRSTVPIQSTMEEDSISRYSFSIHRCRNLGDASTAIRRSSPRPAIEAANHGGSSTNQVLTGSHHDGTRNPRQRETRRWSGEHVSPVTWRPPIGYRGGFAEPRLAAAGIGYVAPSGYGV
jgi:hypothetical protein